MVATATPAPVTTVNYDLLQSIFHPPGTDPAKARSYLEIIKLGVTRFGDDDSEIQLGETVPFVANVRFQLTRAGITALKDSEILELADRDIGKAAFAVNNRAELTSELGLPIDTDSVARWVCDHFDITFRVRGLERSPFRPHTRAPIDVEQVATVEPWLQEINTIAVQGDVIEIDFEVTPKVARPTVPRRTVLSKTIDADFDRGATLGLRFEIHGGYEALAQLKGGRYWIALHAEDGPDLKLAAIIEHVTTPLVGTKLSPTLPLPPPGAGGAPAELTSNTSKPQPSNK